MTLDDLKKTYRQLFNTDEGKIVLNDLELRFHILASTYVPGDPHDTSYREGQRSVVLTILRMMEEKTNQEIQQAKDE
mgnify:CR=1 FL=1|jgi:hypothetical protein|tara:strand:+ start:345 stop:575 length:231 start_codon:yes stop_codon:yes gene_type:complete